MFAGRMAQAEKEKHKCEVSVSFSSNLPIINPDVK